MARRRKRFNSHSEPRRGTVGDARFNSGSTAGAVEPVCAEHDQARHRPSTRLELRIRGANGRSPPSTRGRAAKAVGRPESTHPNPSARTFNSCSPISLELRAAFNSCSTAEAVEPCFLVPPEIPRTGTPFNSRFDYGCGRAGRVTSSTLTRLRGIRRSGWARSFNSTYECSRANATDRKETHGCSRAPAVFGHS